MPDRDSLRRLLTAHAPADATEADYRRRMLELLDVDGDPFARGHFDPGHFTASAFVLDPDAEQLLLILHSKLNLWLQPGGHVDPTDPDLLSGAKREAAEETGIDALDPVGGIGPILDVDIHAIPANPRKGEPAHEHFDVRFLFRARSCAFAAGSDALDARWVALADVEDAGTDDSVSRAVRKLRGLLGR
jgi:8-oxo-dGTP pyrophosphatase MutT (NUDIX family)